MDILEQLKIDAVAAVGDNNPLHSAAATGRVRSVLDAFRRKYECVTVRSLGGSLEIGRPPGVFWVMPDSAGALPAIMLKRPKSDLRDAAREFLDALERGGPTHNEVLALTEALAELEA